MKYTGYHVHTGKPVQVTVEKNIITKVVEAQDVPGLPFLSPGFLDMQVNGYKGADYSSETFAEDDASKIIGYLAESGTSQHIPTIVSSPQELIVRNLKILTEARRNSSLVEAALPAYHIEGPFISQHDGPRGAHDPAYVRTPSYEEYLQWQDAADGLVKLVTLAPEAEGAVRFIEQITKDGTVAAIGHSGAAPEDIHAAVSAGARCSTHLGNGSHSSIPRLKNYIWEQLAADELTAGIIPDSFHLPGSVVKVFTRAKGLSRLVIVSDVAVMGGAQPGVYKWGNLGVEVFEDGHLGLAGTSFLAGAGHLLDWNLPRFMEYTGTSLSDTVSLCTTNPARLLNVSPFNTQILEPGMPAHLTLFHYTPGDQRLQIGKTVINGEEMFSS